MIRPPDIPDVSLRDSQTAAAARADAGITEEGLRLLTRHLLREGPPTRGEARQATPRDRRWLPDAGKLPVPSANVLRRRVEAAYLVGDAPDTRYRRYMGSGGWGRRKRFNSLVLGDTMLAHSSLEFDALRDLELDGTNRWFLEQPLTVRYRVGVRLRRYTPDVLVARTTHFECVEVKYERQAREPETEAKWRAIADCLLEMGLGFRVLTELHVRRQPRFGNVKHVFAHRHQRVEPFRAEAVAAVLAEAGTAKAGDLTRHCGVTLGQVWALARRALVAIDLDHGPIGPNTQVWLRAPLLRPDPARAGDL